MGAISNTVSTTGITTSSTGSTTGSTTSTTRSQTKLEVVPPAQGAVVLSLAVKRARRLFNTGRVLLESGKVEEAITKFEESTQNNPTAEAYTLWAWAKGILGQVDESIRLCHMAIACDRTYANAYNDLGNYLMKRGELDAAIPWLMEAKKAPRGTTRQNPYLNLGRIYLSRCEFPKALTEFEVALEYEPDNSELRMVVARLRSRMAYYS
jgi:tetratricopeptide (TPR) repeat protein